MAKEKSYKIYACDFETTVYDGQEQTEVWAAATVEIGSEDVTVTHSINEFFEDLHSKIGNLKCYFHNLKFDGMFILSYLLKSGYKLALVNNEGTIEWKKSKELNDKEIKVLMSAFGQLYSIEVKDGKRNIVFWDSLKLIPGTLKSIGKSFDTKHRKLEMEYEGERFAGCPITEEEKKYIENDVLVLSEALQKMFKENHVKMTIAGCCMEEYIKTVGGKEAFYEIFPNLHDIELDDEYGAKNADAYIRDSYKGGWCYLVPEKANKIYKNGITCDVNSLYPSVMDEVLNFSYPIGKPKFFTGSIPEEVKGNEEYYYFVRIRCKFYIKDGKLPTVQIKHNYLYKSNEWLITSDVLSDGKYVDRYMDPDGNEQEAKPILTLTKTDYELFKEHYYIDDFEELDGCYFWTMKGLFTDYIQKYKKIKMTSTGALRQIAKLFLNSLYGRFGMKDDSSFKYPYFGENGELKFRTITEHNKKTIYVAIAAAITAYARRFTITAAQANYYGPNKPGFIYADTDSLHMDIPKEEVKGIKFHKTEFACWDLESEWEEGIFVRQKTYIEIENGCYNIKCAGMNDFCKALLELSITQDFSTEHLEKLNIKYDKLKNAEKDFIKEKRTLKDFKPCTNKAETDGLIVPGKLVPVQIPGGVVLRKTYYTMH